MSALRLEPQSLVVVCPDCGQRYDPAKAARVARIRTRDGRAIKPGRVEAQDVATAAHRNGRHHLAHCAATAQALEGWCVVVPEIATLAWASDIPIAEVRIDAPTKLQLVQAPELEDLAIDLESPVLRALAERSWRAARAVRVDHPWWRAYLHEVGASAEEIARGLTVGANNRADVLFRQRVQTVTTPEAASLPGMA
jgi:hypothetical protein